MNHNWRRKGETHSKWWNIFFLENETEQKKSKPVTAISHNVAHSEDHTHATGDSPENCVFSYEDDRFRPKKKNLISNRQAMELVPEL